MDQHGLVPTVPATLSQADPAPNASEAAGSGGTGGLVDMFADDDHEPSTSAIAVNPPSPSSSASPPLGRHNNNASHDEALPPSDSAAPSPRAAISRSLSPSGTPRFRSDRSRSGSSNGSGRRGSRSRSGSRNRGRNPLEYDDEEEGGLGGQKAYEAESITLSETPGLSSSDGQLWSLRLPMYTSCPTYPFHPELYRHKEQAKQDAEDAEDGNDDEKKRERAMVRMHEVRGGIRWRWAEDSTGVAIKKSNSRVIRWSDGTTSLQIGEELFDVNLLATTGPAKPFGTTSSAEEGTPENGTASQNAPTRDIKPNLDGAISIVYKSDFEAQALRPESIVTGVIGLIPVTDKVKNFQKRLQAMTGSGLKKAKITLNTDDSMQDPMIAAMARNKKFEAQETVRLDLKGKTGGNAWKNRSMKGERAAAYEDDDGSGSDLGGRPSGGAGRSSGKKSGRGRKRNTADFYSDDDDDDDDEPPAKRGSARFEVGGGNVGEYEEDDFVVADESDEDVDGQESDEAEDDEEEEEDDEQDLEAVSRKERKKDKSEDKQQRQKRRDFTPDDEKSDLELADQMAEQAAERERKRAKKAKSAPAVQDPDDSDDAMALDDDGEDARPVELTKKKVITDYDSDEED